MIVSVPCATLHPTCCCYCCTVVVYLACSAYIIYIFLARGGRGVLSFCFFAVFVLVFLLICLLCSHWSFSDIARIFSCPAYTYHGHGRQVQQLWHIIVRIVSIGNNVSAPSEHPPVRGGKCVCVCVFIKLHITAQSGLVILVILCHSR